MSSALGPPFSVLVQCPPGIERLLEGEMAGLGIGGERISGGVQWQGGWRELLAAQLHLRTASRILVEVGRFRARALGELERKAGAVPWDDVLPPGGLRLRVSARRSRLNHRRAVEERVRRAARREEGRPLDPLVLVRIHRDEVILRVDASGAHLHRRGYRTRVGEAPLRETLAAAALLQTGWDGTTSLFDPFCGSGTIPIEAALLAMAVPPGLASAHRRPRDAALIRWPGFPQALQDDLVDEARSRIRAGPPAPIGGSDRDGAVLEAARENARDAGVAHAISFAEASASRAPLPPDPGWIVTNPPHGGRLGDRRSLRRLYAALGRSARGPWRAWGMAVLVSDPVLAGALGRGFDPAFVTGSGGARLECRVRPAAPSDPTGPRLRRHSAP